MEKRIEKIKTISKYLVNILTVFNALLLALDEVWNFAFTDKLSGTLLAICGVISVYLLGQKALKK